jgi:hypothetical protein
MFLEQRSETSVQLLNVFRTLWNPANQQESSVVITGVAAQVRAEIGRRLGEHYKVCSRTIPDRLVLLIEDIEQSESRSEQMRNRGHSMSKRDEYMANADECERLAEMAQNPDERAAWLQMAQQWQRWAKRK